MTSCQTAFSVEYLYDCILQILYSNASFESLSKIYGDLHFTNIPTDVMPGRVEAHRKRLSEAIFTYTFLEVGQRYSIPSVIRGGIDNTILEYKTLFKDKFQEKWSSQHKCDIKGCQDCLTIDGGMKPNRFICANKMSVVTEYTKTGLRVVTGCPRKPNPRNKYCHDCKDSESPSINSKDVSNCTKSSLRKHRSETAVFKETNQDQIFVIESLLDIKKIGSETMWKVKWLGFPESEATWEPSGNIQNWMKNYYLEDKTRLGKPLPEPKIKCKKKSAGQTFYYLSWGNNKEDSVPEDRWVTEDFFPNCI